MHSKYVIRPARAGDGAERGATQERRLVQAAHAVVVGVVTLTIASSLTFASVSSAQASPATQNNPDLVPCQPNVVSGVSNTVSGCGNAVSGANNVVRGDFNIVSGSNNTVIGSCWVVSGAGGNYVGNNCG